MPQFDRVVFVKIGPSGSETGVGVSGLRIVFNVKKSIKKGNTCNLDIYNLSEDTRNKIKEIDDVLIIEAGYVSGDVEKTIFIGNISRVTNEKSGADMVTHIEANDGQKDLREKKVSLSYSPGASAHTILKDIIGKMGLPLKISTRLSTILSSKVNQYTNGFSYVGQGKGAISKIAERIGLDWSVQNGDIKFVEKEKTDDATAQLISETTGMVGSPIRKDDIEDGADKDKKKSGWNVKSLLIPNLEPANRVVVESVLIDNTRSEFRIETVNHIGDTRGNDFYTLLTVSDIKT